MFQKLIHAIRVARARRREKKKERTRSPRWAAVRDLHLAAQPTCAACGGIVELQVHHVQPFHLYQDLELDPDNLVTLCMGEFDCHQLIGHGGKWAAWNPFVRKHSMLAKKWPELRFKLVAAAKKARRMS